MALLASLLLGLEPGHFGFPPTLLLLKSFHNRDPETQKYLLYKVPKSAGHKWTLNSSKEGSLFTELATLVSQGAVMSLGAGSHKPSHRWRRRCTEVELTCLSPLWLLLNNQTNKQKTPDWGWGQQTTDIHLPQFWRLTVQDHDTSRFSDWWGPISSSMDVF